MNKIDPITAGVSPEAAVTVVRRGGLLNLAGHNQTDWGLQAWAVSRVAEVDKSIAISTIESDLSRIADCLAKLEEFDRAEFHVLLRTIERLDSNLLTQLLQNVDPKTASANWSKRIQEGRKEMRRDARKVIMIARDRAVGDLKALAEHLLATPKKPRK